MTPDQEKLAGAMRESTPAIVEHLGKLLDLRPSELASVWGQLIAIILKSPGGVEGHAIVASKMSRHLSRRFGTAGIKPGPGDLKPCPFCGGEADLVSQTEDPPRWHVVQCLGCGIEAPSMPDEAAAAVAFWNRRAAMPVVQLHPETDCPGLWIGFRSFEDRARAMGMFVEREG